MRTMDDFCQVSRSSTPSTSFTTDLSELRESLHTSNPQWPHKLKLSANPYPFYSPPHRVQELQKFQSALHTAIQVIIKNWWSTPRYQLAIPLSPKVERVLRSLESRRPYDNLGSYRPDFLIPLHQYGPLSICEINARFMFNGFFSGAYLQDYLASLDFGDNLQGFTNSTIEGIIPAFSEIFDETKPVCLVKGRECGIDIHLFNNCYSKSRFIHPSDLKLAPCGNSPSGYTLRDRYGVIEQIALELHQDELEALEEDVLLEIGARCSNDLRTIFLMHDKRMLGLLLQELDSLVLSKALTSRQASALQSGIVETHLPGTSSFQSILSEPQNRHMWLLKPALAGKGEGIVFGKDVDEETWKSFLKQKPEPAVVGCPPTPTRNTFVIQRYFVQRRHKLIVQPQELGSLPRLVNWFIVGTILCLNKHFLGLTGWRTSSAEIIAVSRGGEYMGGLTSNADSSAYPRLSRINRPDLDLPSTLQISKEARFEAYSADSNPDHITKIKLALRDFGIAVVHLNFSDPNSTYMLNLAKALGKLVDHSKTNDPLWDVKPKSGFDLARSQTAASFPWHTDCSFDTTPPRYFALHVIRADRLGGGKLRVLPVNKALEILHHSTLETLKQPMFRIRVPKEFQKDVEHVTGALVTSDAKIRYRREIIEPLDSAAGKALDELDSVLYSSGDDGLAKTLGADIMKDGTVICLDNGRWMHARSEVRDPQRWLRRVRWGPESF